MKLRTTAGVLISAICVAAWAADGPSQKQDIRAKVEQFGSAITKGDYDAVANLTYAPVVKMNGGHDKMVAAMKSGMEAMKARGIAYVSVNVDDPSEAVSGGADLYVVVPYILKMTVPQGNLLVKTYVIGISSDGGKSWTFVNGVRDTKKLKEVLPKLPEQLKLLEYQEPVLIEK